MRLTEEIAKRVVEAILPGAEMRPFLMQSHGECDFTLHYPDGTVATVEVTESADRQQRAISAEIRNKHKGGATVEAKKCKKSWLITPMKNAQIPKVRKALDEYLSHVEQAGIRKFRFFDALCSRQFSQAGMEGFRVPQCVEEICFGLNIDSGVVIPRRQGPARIFLTHPVGRAAVAQRDAVEAAEREAHKQDNLKKLGAATTKERHLIVYVGAARGSPYIALTDFEPPSMLPMLPAEITNIWLIGPLGMDAFVVWRAGTKESWQRQLIAIPKKELEAS